MKGEDKAVRHLRSTVDSESTLRASRLRRVSPERVYELARHLTERDRVIALTLYRQRPRSSSSCCSSRLVVVRRTGCCSSTETLYSIASIRRFASGMARL